MTKSQGRPRALRSGAMVGNSGHYVKIRKHRGANVPSYYVACFDADGHCVDILDAGYKEGWWMRCEAKAAGARWIADLAKPSPNTNVQRRSGEEPASPSVLKPNDQPPAPERSL